MAYLLTSTETDAAGMVQSQLDQKSDLSSKSPRDRNSNAATGVSAAGARAFGSQAIAFYFRAPVKTFFRTRVE